MPALVAALLVCTGAAFECRSTNDFQIAGPHARVCCLSDFDDRELVVLVFFSAECPLANYYGPRVSALAEQYASAGVAFLGINADQGDAPQDLARFAEQHGIGFPLVKDSGGAVAEQFGATRLFEAFVLDRTRAIKYHGRVDDQYLPGFQRAEPTRDDLKEAIEDLLSGRSEVSVSETDAPGCLIQRAPSQTHSSAVAYSPDIASVLNESCPEGPDPEETARHGKRTIDKMFHGSLDEVPAAREPSRPISPLVAALVSTIGCWVIVRRRAPM